MHDFAFVAFVNLQTYIFMSRYVYNHLLIMVSTDETNALACFFRRAPKLRKTRKEDVWKKKTFSGRHAHKTLPCVSPCRVTSGSGPRAAGQPRRDTSRLIALTGTAMLQRPSGWPDLTGESGKRRPRVSRAGRRRRRERICSF